MKHLIMGTAGHVDHGKTALVKALTGFDCDTHKEEQQRGITIHLGFTHLDLGGGNTVGIVDMPGHRDFIHTMVGGASGIDLVLLVIAADEGIMPQTREHLNIMRILGVRHGIIVLTKSDLADEELREIVKEDIAALVQGTFLETAPVVPASARTGEGLEILKDAIRATIERIQPRPADGVFRLFIDRLFTVAGHGTVATGSVIGGTARTGDTLYLLPGGDEGFRVRRLERHGAEVPEVVAGDRASLNLVGFDRERFRRGMVLADRPLRATILIDAELELYEQGVTLGRWSQVIFHVGTYERQARMHLIDRDAVTTGERALVQLHLPEPVILQHGDRFVIRNSSDEWTLGGGMVVDIAPLHHRRPKDAAVAAVGKLTAGKLADLIAEQVRKFHRATTAAEVADTLNLTVEKVRDGLAKRIADDIVKLEEKGELLLYTEEGMENLRKGALKAIQQFRRDNPLAVRGANFDEIRGALRMDRDTAGESFLRAVLRRQVEKGKLKEKEKTYLPPHDPGDIDDTLRGHIEAIGGYIRECGMQVPLMSVMKELAAKRRMGDKELVQVLLHLVATGAICRMGDEVIDRAVVDACRAKLTAHLEKSGEGITVAGFRDLTGGNRKSSLLLLAIFDNEKLTRREGDLRFLAKKN
ncbi:MAG TPA: selenocysteine-specific translation elongation factor [bacterium]|nr:selenocysteine-specific translation elongation factor [bacterium]